MSTGKAKINWSSVVAEAVTQARGYSQEFGVAGTLRAIYYRLVSVGALPNTRSAYKGLSRALTKARLDGRFPWNLLVDNVRSSTGARSEVDLTYIERWASKEVSDHLTQLEESFGKIEDPSVSYSPSTWSDQTERVVIAIEKDAILGAVRNVTRKMDVEIFPLRGYSSTTFMKKLAERIRGLSRYCPYGQVHLILITDYDPSGEDIVRDVQERLESDYGVYCDVEKILLTKDQIMKYDLPAIPDDAEEIAKMMRDPRFDKWVDGVFRVELDAMAAIVPDEFRRVILESVTKHFDEEVYQKNQTRAEELCESANEELRDLYVQLEEVHEIVRERIDEIRSNMEDED